VDLFNIKFLMDLFLQLITNYSTKGFFSKMKTCDGPRQGAEPESPAAPPAPYD